MNYGLHIIKTPSGNWSYVGEVPKELCIEVPAGRSDIVGGRAFRDANNELKTMKIPRFTSEEEAENFAVRHGCIVLSTPSSRDQGESMRATPKISG